MIYHRFLTNKDYISIATKKHMEDVVREVPERIPQAEQRAEMQLLEYLDQYYEIEKVLAVGKNIREYNIGVCYPGQAYIRKDEEIFKTLTAINGLKKPSKKKYWKQVVEFVDPCLIDNAKKYSQLRTYSLGEVVKFGTEYFQCLIPHGYEADEIHIPGVETWKEAEITPWEPNLEWKLNQVCSFNGNFYQYLKGEEVSDPNTPVTPDPNPTTLPDPSANPDPMATPDPSTVSTPTVQTNEDPDPETNENWGMIGDYSEELEYNYSDGAFDYVVADGTVFYPILNPNPTALEEGVTIIRDDPRNPNVVAHLARIALYHLHSIISPTNISETRRMAYEDSILWLYNASKFKINPQLPRKREHDSCLPKVDWACETFQRDFDANENPWLI